MIARKPQILAPNPQIVPGVVEPAANKMRVPVQEQEVGGCVVHFDLGRAQVVDEACAVLTDPQQTIHVLALLLEIIVLRTELLVRQEGFVSGIVHDNPGEDRLLALDLVGAHHAGTKERSFSVDAHVDGSNRHARADQHPGVHTLDLSMQQVNQLEKEGAVAELRLVYPQPDNGVRHGLRERAADQARILHPPDGRFELRLREIAEEVENLQNFARRPLQQLSKAHNVDEAYNAAFVTHGRDRRSRHLGDLDLAGPSLLTRQKLSPAHVWNRQPRLTTDRSKSEAEHDGQSPAISRHHFIEATLQHIGAQTGLRQPRLWSSVSTLPSGIGNRVAGEWIIKFKGRNDTGAYQQNLLWRSGNLFVMDNHRAAAWCWDHLLGGGVDQVLVHIDRHNDALQSQLDVWLSHLPQGIPASVDDYLNLTYPIAQSQFPLFRWDNYLSIYLALQGAHVRELILATQGEGDHPNHAGITSLDSATLLSELEARVLSSGLPAIINLDLDYFFETDNMDTLVRSLDDTYVDELADVIGRLDRAGRLPVITVALTATEDLTGGWGPAEALAERICSALGHQFKLPA